MLNVIILGASSAIAEAAARIWAEQGAHLMLVGRNASRLDAIADDLRSRGANVEACVADLADGDMSRTFQSLAARMGRTDIVLLAYGILGLQNNAETAPEDTEKIITTNFTSAAAWCLVAADAFERQNHGRLVVLGSVAGDRGRASNYLYGATKGGLAILVQGIAHRLADTRASAVLLKLGFVDTPMTAHIGRKGVLWSRPETIGRNVVRICERAAVPPIVYLPWFWRWIMLVIRFTPSAIFHRFKL